MIGFRKKPGNKEQEKPQKKKWEEELVDDEDEAGTTKIVLDKAELAKLAKSDDEEGDDKMVPEENKQEEGTLGITFKEKADEEEEEKEDENEKELAWMSSEDEAIAREVEEDEMKEENEGNQGENKDGADRDTRTIFVSNLPVKAEDEEIKKFFAQFGYVVEIDVPRNEGARVNKGRAFIEYATIEDAAKALEANGVKFEGCLLTITQGLNNATTNLANSKDKQPVMMTFTNVIGEKGQQIGEEENEIQMEKGDDDGDAEDDSEQEERDEDDDSDKSGGSDSDSEDSSKKKKKGGRKKRDEEDENDGKKRERSRSQEKAAEKMQVDPKIQHEQQIEERYSKPGKKRR